jgi:hypothetical protein
MDRIAVAILAACLLLCPATCGAEGACEPHDPLHRGGAEVPCGCVCGGAIRSESDSAPGVDEFDPGALEVCHGHVEYDPSHGALSRLTRTRFETLPDLSLRLWVLLLRFLC